ncbi:hypothetical protein IMY05_C5254000400 [Salix suchowensis]|nr:hypothetical protein IMY05_C5254000400 [Salix suchowensis]
MQSKKLVSPAHAEINITGLVIGLSKIWWLVSGKAIKTFVEVHVGLLDLRISVNKASMVLLSEW